MDPGMNFQTEKRDRQKKEKCSGLQRIFEIRDLILQIIVDSISTGCGQEDRTKKIGADTFEIGFEFTGKQGNHD